MRLFRTLAALVFTAALAQGAVAQTEIDIPTAKRLAFILADTGQPRAARQVAVALLRRSPDDPDLLIVLSKAERGLGNYDAAIRAGKRGFALANSKDQKFTAARATAQALASNGQRTMAQIWLRRAGQNAPTDQAAAVIRRDYSYVRTRNPWAFTFGGSVAPTDNANDAPTSNEMVIGGLVFTDPTALPIPGTEITFSATATYRLPATETRQTQVSLSYDARRVRLGRDAAAIDPTLRNRDFSADRVTLEWAAKFLNPRRQGIFDVSLRAFADWNAGTHSQNGLALSGGYSWAAGNSGRLRLGAEVENLNRIDRPIRSSLTKRLRADWSAALPNRDRVGLRLTLADTASSSFAVAHAAAGLRASYEFAQPVLSMNFGVSAEYRMALFDRPLYSPERRRDKTLTLGVSAALPELDLYGFTPVIELRHETNRSNVARFDIQSTQIGLSIRSAY